MKKSKIRKDLPLYKRYYSPVKKSSAHNKFNLSKVFFIIWGLLILFLLAYTFDAWLFRGKIYPQVQVLEQKIGGLTRYQAQSSLQPVIEKIISYPLIINYEGWQQTVIPKENLGAFINVEILINEAYEIGRRGSFWARIRERLFLLRNNYQLYPKVNFEEDKFNTFYNQLQTKFERSPRNASLVYNRIISARKGIVIDQKKLLEDLTNAILKAFQSDKPISINLAVTYSEPEITTKEVLASIGVYEIISQYETSLLGKEINTLYNINKASEEIDGIIIKPQEIFSFNKLIGPAEKEDGYKESIIIANGKFVNGYGGGVCQVSTTLYNAALLANLQIIERYNHSIYGEATNYVPLGRDAAVFYGYKDLKFKNSQEQLIVIFSEVKPDRLVVTIWGEKRLDKNIKIKTQDQKTYDYEVIEIKKEGKSTVNDANDVIQEGIPGYSIKTYRVIQDTFGERVEFISDDRYASVPKKILVD